MPMPDSRSGPAMSEEQIRTELGTVLDELQRLPPDAFRERSRLRGRQAELAQMLREIQVPGSEDIARRWAERAGGKTEEDGGNPEIVSPAESGGGGGY